MLRNTYGINNIAVASGIDIQNAIDCLVGMRCKFEFDINPAFGAQVAVSSSSRLTHLDQFSFQRETVPCNSLKRQRWP